MEQVVTGDEHVEARALFAPRVDRELTPEQERWLAGHLAGCPACRDALARYERAVTLVRGLPRARAPRDFSTQVLRRVRRRRGPLRSAASVLSEVSIPIEAAIPVVIAAIVAAILILASQ